MSSIAFQISDHTLTFFAKSRSWSVASDAANFKQIREGLLTASMTADKLIELADAKIGIETDDGTLQFVGDDLHYKGKSLANVWVDKILKFRAESLPFDPIYKALESLLKNPSFGARERLPIFVEVSKLGFLPDGRIAAFKVIRNDWKDIRTGTFDNSVGAKVSMPRDEVDDNFERSCSYGLHVGALAYIRDYGLYDSDKRVVLVAVKPEDFVAVPKDYNGSKARVSSYEVLEEVDKQFIAEFVENNQTVVHSSSYEDEESTFDRVARVIEELTDNLFDLDASHSLLDIDLEDRVPTIERALEEEFQILGLSLARDATIADIARTIDTVFANRTLVS